MSLNRICDECPMQEVRHQEILPLGIQKVAEAEEEGRSIGKAKSELGILVNACRRMRAENRCDKDVSDAEYSSYEDWLEGQDRETQQREADNGTFVANHWATSEMVRVPYERLAYTIEDQIGDH